jgi:hypothetical protein
MTISDTEKTAMLDVSSNVTFVKIEVAIELANHTYRIRRKIIRDVHKALSHITQSESAVLIILTRVPNMRRGLW